MKTRRNTKEVWRASARLPLRSVLVFDAIIRGRSDHVIHLSTNIYCNFGNCCHDIYFHTNFAQHTLRLVVPNGRKFVQNESSIAENMGINISVFSCFCRNRKKNFAAFSFAE